MPHGHPCPSPCVLFQSHLVSHIKDTFFRYSLSDDISIAGVLFPPYWLDPLEFVTARLALESDACLPVWNDECMEGLRGCREPGNRCQWQTPGTQVSKQDPESLQADQVSAVPFGSFNWPI